MRACEIEELSGERSPRARLPRAPRAPGRRRPEPASRHAVSEAAPQSQTLLECGECARFVVRRRRSAASRARPAHSRARCRRPTPSRPSMRVIETSSAALDLADRARSWPAAVRARARVRSSDAGRREDRLESRVPFPEVRVRQPEPAEGASEAHRGLVVSVRRQPVERGAKVVVIALEPRRPFHLVLEASAIGVLCERREVVGVPTPVDLASSRPLRAARPRTREWCRAKESGHRRWLSGGLRRRASRVDRCPRHRLLRRRRGGTRLRRRTAVRRDRETARRAGHNSRRSSPAASSDAPVRRELRP